MSIQGVSLSQLHFRVALVVENFIDRTAETVVDKDSLRWLTEACVLLLELRARNELSLRVGWSVDVVVFEPYILGILAYRDPASNLVTSCANLRDFVVQNLGSFLLALRDPASADQDARDQCTERHARVRSKDQFECRY